MRFKSRFHTGQILWQGKCHFNRRKRSVGGCSFFFFQIQIDHLLVDTLAVSTEVLKGKNVVGLKGIIIGEVEGAEIDVDGWKVTQMHVSLTEDVEKQLGFKTGLIRSKLSKQVVSIPIESIGEVGDVVNATVDMNDLKSLARPEMKATT